MMKALFSLTGKDNENDRKTELFSAVLLLTTTVITANYAAVSLSALERIELHHDLLPYRTLRVSSFLKCAVQCHVEINMCQAFSYSPGDNCDLYDCINPTYTGPDTHIVYYNPDRVPPLILSLALGKPAEMSSLYGNDEASQGNNGIVSGDYFETQQEYGAWWRVDLGEIYCIWEVRFINRVESGLLQIVVGWRAEDVAVTVAINKVESFDTENHLCGFVAGNIEEDNTVKCNPALAGKFVLLRNSPTKQAHFHLREVFVHAK